MKDIIERAKGPCRGCAIACVVLFLLLVGCFVGKVNAADRTITCDPPTHDVGPDGLPFTSDDQPFGPGRVIDGYNWHVDGVFEQNTPDCSWVLSKPDGSYDIRVSTITTPGGEGPQSPVVNFTLTTAVPNPPSNLR